MSRKILTILIPCYNESSVIKKLSKEIKPVLSKLSKDYEIDFLFVNDGSTDDTEKCLINEFKDQCRIISYDKNRGPGHAFKVGFKSAKGDIIITTDADCTYDPDTIPEILSLLTDDYDLVTASPYHPNGSVEGVDFIRYNLSLFISKIYKLLTQSEINTFSSFFRVYRSNITKDLGKKPNGYIIATEILVDSILQGFKVKEYPTTLRVRTLGSSNMKLIKEIRDNFFYITKLVYNRT